MDKLTNEELVELYKKGKEEAGNELFNRNKGLIYEIVRKFNNKSRLSEEDIISASYYGFAKAIKTFNESKGIKFSTYCYTVMKNEVCKSLEYYKYKKNDDSDFIISSLDLKISLENKKSSLIEILDASDNDVLHKNDYTYLHNAIEYARTLIIEKYHPYLLPLLFRETTTYEVAPIIGVSPRTVHYTTTMFREHVREYIYHYSNGEIVS
ncbi:sigma-70 family RNA polymerase sigma factor [Lysinibacillus agricola]|uniref:Sigma-70 family RNA polymerase sigma factor n=1 Tax=Lysinibacillus agricola TaxID=2590012 RepID=A0ABX7ALY8_9BACI|nr:MULTISPECIES: sigma-70 family RNA polymerase sigma factor [Lysinibacillus]KOS61542.1 hypothetical protein AN161_18305 [Lysinibacillus sp. FJAT-14222]QQP10761.1 sigma-70 family RNA polymerase sigma factor [Lysinibacillus agricola]